MGPVSVRPGTDGPGSFMWVGNVWAQDLSVQERTVQDLTVQEPTVQDVSCNSDRVVLNRCEAITMSSH